MRPSSAGPTGTRTTSPVPRTVSPASIAVDVVEQHAADAVAFERLGEAELSLVEAQQFVEPDVGQSGDERDAVLDLLDAPDLLHPRAELDGAERGAGALQPGVRGRVNVLRHVRCPRECD